MSIICPAVLAADPHAYRDQIERITSFAKRIQVDLTDGDFAASQTINPAQVWWPDNLLADIHLMFRNPLSQIETLVSLMPHLIIIHAEADGDLAGMLNHIQKFGIKTGVCLLKDTSVKSAQNLLEIADHALLFSGSLGSFGGVADLAVLSKIPEIKAIKPEIEIGWDGGANQDNVTDLAKAGVDVINAGGAVQNAQDPEAAFKKLTALV